jgi:hypothetical protein
MGYGHGLEKHMTCRTNVYQLSSVTISKPDANHQPRLRVFVGGHEKCDVQLTKGMLVKLNKELAEAMRADKA